MFRLFKIDKKNKRKGPEEVKLQGNYYSIENNSIESIGRSGRLGLRSFTWTYDGKYLSTANKMILGDLTLYGDSLNVFEEKIYDDLLVPQSGDWYAVVGWAPPPNNAGGLFSQEEIKALKTSLVTLWIHFKIPQFTFNQDGTFELNLSFRSAILQALNNIDIFGPSNRGEEILNLESGFKTSVLTGFKKFLKKRDLSLKQGKWGDHSIVARGWNLGTVNRSSSSLKVKKIDEMSLKSFKNEIARLTGIQPDTASQARKLIDAFMNTEQVSGDLDYATVMADRFYALLERKRSNKVFRKILEDITKEKRKFYITLSATDFENFYQAHGPIDLATIKSAGAPKLTPGKPPPKQPVKAKEAGALLKKSAEVKTTLGKLEPDEISVAFVYFGDIIDSLLSTTKYQSKNHAERVNFILSTLAYKDYFLKGSTARSTLTQVPIVDIPISVSYFTKWFHDEYVVKFSEKVTLDEFLNKAFKTLLLPAMGPDNFRASLKNHASAPHQFSWTADKKGNQPPRGLIKFQDLQDLIYQGSMTANPISYVAYSSWIYAEDEKAKASKASRHSSSGKNMVLHLAKDRGLLKDVSFSRINSPHWEADKIRNDNITNNLERIRVPYNVSIKMVGNNFFFPGTRFDVIPTIPGAKSADIAKRMGLGGTYLAQSITNRIETESGFTTEFSGVNTRMSGKEKQGKKPAPPPKQSKKSKIARNTK